MGVVDVVTNAVVVITITYLLWKIKGFLAKYRSWKEMSASKHVAIVGPLHPIWGSLHLFKDFTGYSNVVNDLVQKERPKFYCMWNMFLFPRIGICHPDTAQVIYKSSAPKNTAIGGGYRFILEWIGDGLLISDGKKWERNRKLLTPAFHFDTLKPYMNIYNRSADKMLTNIASHAKDGTPVEIFEYVTLATLDTILRTAFSYESTIQDDGLNHPYAHAVTRLSHLTLNRYQQPWFLFDAIYKLFSEGKEFTKLCNYSHNFTRPVIEKRRKTLESEGSPTNRYLDFLDILLLAKDEDGHCMSDEDIQAEVETFLFEGHDTTASGISWAIYNLGKYQDEQAKVYQEVCEVLGENDDLTWGNLSQVPKLTAFIKESMRMFPPVPITGRVLTSPLRFGDFVIPEGIQIEINVNMIHHHPDVWPEHEKFKPERFLDGASADRHPYSYVPFAAGSRNCIGQQFAMNELKVVIGRFVRRFKVSLVDDFEYEVVPEVIMRSKNGIKVKIANRK